MTINELLREASHLAHLTPPNIKAAALARGLRELFATAFPCGFSEPTLIDGEVWAGEITFGTPEEARGYAIGILRACEAAPP